MSEAGRRQQLVQLRAGHVIPQVPQQLRFTILGRQGGRCSLPVGDVVEPRCEAISVIVWVARVPEGAFAEACRA